MRDLYYNSKEVLNLYCDFHYGDSHFGLESFHRRCVRLATDCTNDPSNAIDVGCAVGRATFELGTNFSTVVGIDAAPAMVQVAQNAKATGNVSWTRVREGAFVEHRELTLRDLNLADSADRVTFRVGDALTSSAYPGCYSLVFACNIVDRARNPAMLISALANKVAPGGTLFIASPFTWSSDFTPKEAWLGDPRKNITSFDDICGRVAETFKLIMGPDEVEFAIRETERKYQHTWAVVGAWRRSYTQVGGSL